MRFLKGFGQFWYDFVIGDDWKIAVGTLTVLLVGAVLVLNGITGGAMVALVGLAVGAAFALVMLVDVRKSSSDRS